MGPYVTVNAVLIGFFGFAAIYHFVLWSQSRSQAVLLVFALHCVLCSAYGACLLALVTAHTPLEGQRALDLRFDFGVLGQVSSVWVLSLISGVRARRFVWGITAVFVTATLVNVALLPLTGTVTAVDQILTTWGETVSILHRESPSPWLGLLYAIALATYVFQLICVVRVWSHDRIGGALFAVAWCLMTAGGLRAARIDTAASPGLYLGALPYAAWALLFAVQIARDYRQRGERLALSERRFRAIFDHTFQFIGLMALDGTLLEVNRSALGFAGLHANDVVGKLFWETPWWTHSSSLQERLRHAVGAAASG